MIRDHGDAVEADLAFQGVDLRVLFLPGRELTWRRLGVLVRALPADSFTRVALQAEYERSLKHTDVQTHRDRAAYYAQRAEEATE